MKAIVLIGRSGCGKDTIANLICSTYHHYSIHKFAQPIKDLVAAAVGVPVKTCEDKLQRSMPIVFWGGKPKSILDLLQDSYIEQKETPLHNMMVNRVVMKARSTVRPIFTDVRNIDEAEAILKTFDEVKAYHIIRPGCDTDIMGEETLNKLHKMFGSQCVLNEHPDDVGRIAHMVISGD